jgi:hypothetical protein
MILIMADNSSFIKQILTLEKLILEVNDGSDFPRKVDKVLRGFEPIHFLGMESLKDCLHYHQTVRQYYSPKGFGKFNLTLVNNGSFFIVVMFMDDQSTEIHDHPFWGCFTPILGSPYEVAFKFQPSNQLHDRLSVGDLVPIRSKRISPMEPVIIDKDSIHLILRPTAGQFSLLIGQTLDKEHRENHHYYYPGLRVMNRPDYSYINRLLTYLESTALKDQELVSILEKLESDEILRFLQHVRAVKNIALQTQLQDVMSIKYKMLWDSVNVHDSYMEKLQSKLVLT